MNKNTIKSPVKTTQKTPVKSPQNVSKLQSNTVTKTPPKLSPKTKTVAPVAKKIASKKNTEEEEENEGEIENEEEMTLADHIAKELIYCLSNKTLTSNNVLGKINQAIDSFESRESPKQILQKPKSTPQVAKKIIPPNKNLPTINLNDDLYNPGKPKPKKKEPVETHECERIKRNCDEPCGKATKKSLEDDNGEIHWYCSACYVTESKKVGGEATPKKSPVKSTTPVKETAKSTKSTPVAKSTKPSKPTTNTAKKALADAKSESLLQKFARMPKLNVCTIKTKDHGEVCMDRSSRVLIDKITKEAYGILAKDNNTILEIGDEMVRKLEASNHTVRQKKLVDTTESEDEENNEDQPEEEENNEEEEENNECDVNEEEEEIDLGEDNEETEIDLENEEDIDNNGENEEIDLGEEGDEDQEEEEGDEGDEEEGDEEEGEEDDGAVVESAEED